MLNISKNISLAAYTTFKIGGEARYFVSVASEGELKEAVKWANNNNLPIFVLGGGSNILVSDKGFNGLVVKIEMKNIEMGKNSIAVDAGVPLAALLSRAAANNFSGLEWAIGIPGTVGGAIRGNSGAFGKETGNSVASVDVFDVSKMKASRYQKEDCGFAYRDSIFKKNPNLVITGAVFQFKNGKKEDVQSLIKEYLLDRSRSNTGLGKSAGCFFKNIPWSRKDLDKDLLLKNFPEFKNYSEKPKIATGFLIDYLGLKGKSVGGALIPYQHANYIINKNKASAEDVIILANLVKEKIQHHYGFLLEEEVELVGF